MGQQLYYVAAAQPHDLSEAQQALLRDASRGRAGRRRLYLFSGIVLFAVVAALTWILYTRMYSRDLPLAEHAHATAQDAVYFTMIGVMLVAVYTWVEQAILHGAKHARRSVLWLRRFHLSDGAQRYFNKHFARITPATFAVTLRDSKVTGNRREGMRRATPLMFGVLLISLGAVATWAPLWDWCQAHETQCAVIDRVWMDPYLAESGWDVSLRSFTVAFVVILTALCSVLLLWGVVYWLSARFGDTRGDTIAGVTGWYEGQAKGSPNRTYVLRTSDTDWQRVVSFLHDRSCLTVFDLTAPSRHLDYELSLARAGRRYAFICRASRGGPFADPTAFIQFLRGRVAPDLLATLQVESMDRQAALRRLRALTQTSLQP